MSPEEDKDQAVRVRGGVIGNGVWIVLTVGIFGVIAAFIVAYFFVFAGAPNPGGVT